MEEPGSGKRAEWAQTFLLVFLSTAKEERKGSTREGKGGSHRKTRETENQKKSEDEQREVKISLDGPLNESWRRKREEHRRRRRRKRNKKILPGHSSTLHRNNLHHGISAFPFLVSFHQPGPLRNLRW